MTLISGVDYAFQKPNIQALANAGVRFACRYGGPGTEDKWLHPDEAKALAAAGISIVANAEGGASGMAGGYGVGQAWAQTADAWFRKCGMPPEKPIYFSVDFDVVSGQWLSVRNALRGAASVIGPDRVGIYGGLNAVLWARNDGVAKWFWQTYAWSHGQWADGNHLEQYRNGVILGGANLDLNHALQTDFGQWMPTTKGREMLGACKFGDTSPEVLDLQVALLARGESIGKNADGSPMLDSNYGPRVSAALARQIGGDGSTVTVDGVTMSAAKTFGVPELLKFLSYTAPHMHNTPATLTGPAVTKL